MAGGTFTAWVAAAAFAVAAATPASAALPDLAATPVECAAYDQHTNSCDQISWLAFNGARSGAAWARLWVPIIPALVGAREVDPEPPAPSAELTIAAPFVVTSGDLVCVEYSAAEVGIALLEPLEPAGAEAALLDGFTADYRGLGTLCGQYVATPAGWVYRAIGGAAELALTLFDRAGGDGLRLRLQPR